MGLTYAASSETKLVYASWTDCVHHRGTVPVFPDGELTFTGPPAMSWTHVGAWMPASMRSRSPRGFFGFAWFQARTAETAESMLAVTMGEFFFGWSTSHCPSMM